MLALPGMHWGIMYMYKVLVDWMMGGRKQVVFLMSSA